MTRVQALKLVGELMAAHRGVSQIPAETVEVYAKDLIDLHYVIAETAIKQLRQTSKWLPTIAEIRAVAAHITHPVPAPDQAWAEVQAQMRAVGWCGRPTWSHQAITETVRAMGWRELCASTVPGVDRAQFLRLYGARQTRMAEQQSLSPDVREMIDVIGQQTTLEAADQRRELEGRSEREAS